MFSPKGPINSIFDLSSGAAIAVKLKLPRAKKVAACFSNLFFVVQGELILIFVPIIDSYLAKYSMYCYHAHMFNSSEKK